MPHPAPQALDDPIDALAPMLAQLARRHTSGPFEQVPAPAPAPQPAAAAAAAAPSAAQPQLARPPCTLLYGGIDLTAAAPEACCPAALQAEACEEALRAQAAVWVAAVQQQLRARLQHWDTAPQAALA